MKKESFLIVISLIALFFTMPSFAHKVNIFANFDGEKIKGYAYYSSGKPAKNSQVLIAMPDGEHIDQLKTDSNGRFVFSPKAKGTYKLILKAADGHLAETYINIKKENLPSDKKGLKKNNLFLQEDLQRHSAKCNLTIKQLDKLLIKRLAPIEKQIEQLVIAQSKITFHDVVSGLGYIFGIMGIWAYLSSKKADK